MVHYTVNIKAKIFILKSHIGGGCKDEYTTKRQTLYSRTTHTASRIQVI